MTLGAVPTPQPQPVETLAYLPSSHIVEYAKGQCIYSPDQPPIKLYLVVEGKVKVSRRSDYGRPVMIDVYGPDELFGESAFCAWVEPAERATAMDVPKLMVWTTAEIEELIIVRPRLGLALLQLVARRNFDLAQRIQSFCVDSLACRLARFLIRFSERRGTVQEDGSVRMMAFTHELLSQYVGTSREIVSHYMNQFRRDGYIRYSRQSVTVYQDA